MKFSPQPLYLFLLIFLLTATQASSVYEITDLTATNSAVFSYEADSWTLTSQTSAASPKYTNDCDGSFLLGGYQKVLNKGGYTKTFYSIPAHSSFSLTMKVWLIDQWPSNSNISIKIGSSEPIKALEPASNQANWTSPSICGDPNSQDLPSVILTMQGIHNGGTFTLSVLGDTNDGSTNPISFGIRDLTIVFSDNAVSGTNFYSYPPSGSLSYGATTCSNSQTYQNLTDNFCYPCSEECQSCYGPESTQCISCSQDYPFNPASGTCSFKCPASYLYPDGNCYTSCSPLLPQTQNGNSYCNSPCTNYLVSSDNSSCLNSCDSPFKTVTEKGVSYCQPPCQGDPSRPFYSPSSDSCEAECPPPMLILNQTTYHLCVAAPETPLTSMGKASKHSNDVTKGGLIAASVAVVGNPSAITMGLLSKMFAYMKYLKIGYSDELRGVLKTWSTEFIPFDLSPDVPQTLADESEYKKVPYIFSIWDVDASFIVNIWNNFLPLGIAILLFSISAIIETASTPTKKKLSSYYLSGYLKNMASNFLITFIYNNYGEIIFNAVMDYRTTPLNSWTSVSNLLVSFIFVLAGPIFFVFHVQKLLHYSQQKKSSTVKEQYSEEFLDKNKTTKVLYESFKDNTPFNHGFLLIGTIRDTIVNIILVTLFDHPLTQIILISSIALSTWVYLVIARPFKETLEMIQQILMELILFIVNICVLITACFDEKNQEAYDGRIHLGKIIITLNLIFNISVAVFLVVGLLMAGYELFCKWKQAKGKVFSEKVQLKQVKTTMLNNTMNNTTLQLDGSSIMNNSFVPFAQRKLDTVYIESIDENSSPKKRIKTKNFAQVGVERGIQVMNVNQSHNQHVRMSQFITHDQDTSNVGIAPE